MPIKELERKTGYARRYLDLLFKHHVGLSPKVLAGIFRFQKFYQKWARGLSYDAFKEELYDYYYDRAHFSEEFKRNDWARSPGIHDRCFQCVQAAPLPEAALPILTIQTPGSLPIFLRCNRREKIHYV
jgi:hypothetical protein